MLDKIVYAAIAVGLAACSAGVVYVVSFEGRISRLEAQVGFISGASSVPTPTQTLSEVAESLKTEAPQGALLSVQSEKIQSAIANGCSNYMTTYNKIVATSDLYSAEKERMKALAEQMQLLGCDKVLK